MVPLGREYRRLVEEDSTQGDALFSSHPLKIPMFSSATSDIIENSSTLTPSYWQTNLTSPVLFDSAVRRLLCRQPDTVFLEIGPHSTLAGPLRQICSDVGSSCNYIPTMVRNADCHETILSALGQLFQQGVPFSFEHLTTGANVLTDLPSYPWDHRVSYWYESRLSKDWRFREHGHHGLLGLRVVESTRTEPSWRNVLSLEDETWLRGHIIGGDVVLPFCAYIAMAGECMRQIAGAQDGYSLRHIIVHTALVLTDSKAVELITSLRPLKLTDSLDSEWFEFTISSNSGATWIKNCEGQVKSRQGRLALAEVFQNYPREVSPSRWYAAMSQIGFDYGPEFCGLAKITSSTTENLSVGEVEDNLQETSYLFHPATLDACLQLLLVAISKGLARNLGQLTIPTSIEDVEIARSAGKMVAKAGYLTVADELGVDCVSEGRTCLRLRGVHMTPIVDRETLDAWDPHAASRLEWSPDFDFLDAAPLIRPPKSNIEETTLQEELTLLCILDAAERLRVLETKLWHFEKYKNWLQKEVRRAKDGLYPIVKNSRELAGLQPAERQDLLKRHMQQLLCSDTKAPVAIATKRISENVEALFTGKADTLDVLMHGGLLIEVYNAISFGHGDFVRALSHTKPDLRILEVGAGTGGTTVSVLPDLVDKNGYPLYSLYSFTDVSAGFFPQAKDRFSQAHNMDYKVYDVSQDPLDQGFEAASYDLIIAPNVIHATPSLYKTLSYLKLLLRPDGHLVLTELCGEARTQNFVFGNFLGWWLGEADNRPDEPYVSVDRWHQELLAAGFTGVDTAVFDTEPPYQYCAAIVSQPRSDTSTRLDRKAITILCEDPDHEITQCLVSEIKSLKIDYTLCRLGNCLPQERDIIFTLDLESPFFGNISGQRFKALQECLFEHSRQNVLWLTRPSQIRCEDPRSAQTIGAARTIRSELAAAFTTLEIDPSQHKFGLLVMQVFEKIISRENIGALAPDREFAVDDGVIKIARYHPFSLREELRQKNLTQNVDRPLTLEIKKPGLMPTLQWSQTSMSEDLGKDEVEIQTAAVGLNFRVGRASLSRFRLLIQTLGCGVRHGYSEIWPRKRSPRPRHHRHYSTDWIERSKRCSR